MRTCTLHIGTPKAGSTTIQGFLRLNAERLLERGVLVPTIGDMTVSRSGMRLANALAHERDPLSPSSEAWRALDAQIGRSDRDLVLSSEFFCLQFTRAGRVAFVTEFFRLRNIRLKVVIYVRDSVSYLNSLYTQGAKKLSVAESFDAWAEDALEKHGARHCYWRMVRHMVEAEDVEVVARPLDNLSAGCLVRDFAGIIGHADLGAPDEAISRFRNVTPGARAIEASVRVARALRAEGASRPGRRVIRACRQELAAQTWPDAPFVGPDARLAARITERFRAGNEAFAERLWGAPWASEVRTSDRTRNVFDPVHASREEVADIDAFVRSFVGRSVAQSPWRRLRRWSRPAWAWISQRASSFRPARINASVGALSPAAFNAATMAALACGAA